MHSCAQMVQNVICISPDEKIRPMYEASSSGSMYCFTLFNPCKLLLKPGQQVKLDLLVNVKCESSETGTNALFLLQNESMSRTPIRLAQQCCPVYNQKHIRIAVDNIGRVPYTLAEHQGVIDVVMPNLAPFHILLDQKH